ncbi:uncharacterized protein [Dysidea avara]|uniref:uncharacterized protein n=1 Tax=Dysidea avara TaxID=196820 RepID=UPI003328611F
MQFAPDVDTTTPEHLNQPVPQVNGDRTDPYDVSHINHMEWEENGRRSPTPNMESFPPQPDCVTEILSMDQLSSHNSDSVVPASVSLHQSEQRNGQEQMRCGIPMECSELEAIMEGCLPFVVNSTAIAIASSNPRSQYTSVHNEQVTAVQLPQQEDDPCYRCDHMKILVFLVTCCNATVCRTCADEIVKYQKCPFCNQCVGDIRRVM